MKITTPTNFTLVGTTNRRMWVKDVPVRYTNDLIRVVMFSKFIKRI